MRKTVIAIISLGLLAFAIIGAVVFVKTAPKAERKQPPKMAPLVDTQPLERTDETVVLHLTGTVMPAEEVLLRARVGGEVVKTAPEFLEGGLFSRGTHILTLDPTDYELALAQAQSALETARFNYKLELGRQDVAKREWELINSGEEASDAEKELALRIPHLAASKAALQAAESMLAKAELDLTRTEIRAPFNAVVLSADVNVGSQASPQDRLARLVGTDTYWIRVSIPVDRIDWVTIPGSPVRVVSSSGATHEGRVIKLLGDIEERGRMARLLVEVEDPLCLKPESKEGKPLLLSEYVRTEIQGRELKGVYNIPRHALRENNLIWIARDGKLEIRKAEVLWRGTRHVLIRALNEDAAQDLLIVSDMTTPIQGMDVNTGKDQKEKPRNTPNTRKNTKPDAAK